MGSKMKSYVYRTIKKNDVYSVVEIGELDSPRSCPDEWCDRRVCEGFWGDEDTARYVCECLNKRYSDCLASVTDVTLEVIEMKRREFVMANGCEPTHVSINVKYKESISEGASLFSGVVMELVSVHGMYVAWRSESTMNLTDLTNLRFALPSDVVCYKL